jgi:glycyl-tRNA synthetase
MAEIEHFVDPLNKSHKKFKSIAHIKLPLYSREIQQNMGEPEWISIGEAVEKKIVDN